MALVSAPAAATETLPTTGDSATATISIGGAVSFPGTYPIFPGERLSEALARAGGLTDSAYPYGAVFLRKSLAQEALAADRVVLHDLIAKCLQQASLSSDDCPQKQILTRADSNPADVDAGRITVVADPAVLALHPDKDPLLESGDTIFVPVRPTTVMVTGAVSHPGNYPYALKARLDDYLSKAGGFAGNAEEDQSFVIYPDGVARSVETSWLYFQSAAIPPGSTIVVPRQP